MLKTVVLLHIFVETVIIWWIEMKRRTAFTYLSNILSRCWLLNKDLVFFIYMWMKHLLDSFPFTMPSSFIFTINIFPQFWHPFNHNQTTLVSVLTKKFKVSILHQEEHQQTWVFLTWTCWGPQLTATTSLTSFFSLSLTASSTAISQKGFIECLTPSVTTPVWSGLTRIWGGQRQRDNAETSRTWTTNASHDFSFLGELLL